MSIASGFKKIKEYIKGSDGKYYQKSAWTSAETVEMNDGTTVQSKLTSVASDASTAKTNAASAVSTASSASTKAQEAIDGLSDKADVGHTHSGYVPTSRTINGYSLTQNRTLNYNDVGAAAADHTHSGYASASHTHSNYVPTTRTINDKQLNQNISLTYSDVGAAAASHSHSEYASASHSHAGTYVPYSRKVQGTTLGSSDVTLYGTNVTMSSSDSTTLKSAIDGKASASHSHSEYVPTTRTVNDKALSRNISLTYSDVGAAAASHTHSGYQSTITGGASSITSNNLNPGYVLISNSNGKVAESSKITISNLNCLDGLVNNVQAALTEYEGLAAIGRNHVLYKTSGTTSISSSPASIYDPTTTLEKGTWLIIGVLKLSSRLADGKRIRVGVGASTASASNTLLNEASGPTGIIQCMNVVSSSGSTKVSMFADTDGSSVTAQWSSTPGQSTRIICLQISPYAWSI